MRTSPWRTSGYSVARTPDHVVWDLSLIHIYSDTNPILAQFDKVFGNSTANMPNTTFDAYENWAMKIILERYNGDLKLLEQDVRSKFSSRSGATKMCIRDRLQTAKRNFSIRRKKLCIGKKGSFLLIANARDST